MKIELRIVALFILAILINNKVGAQFCRSWSNALGTLGNDGWPAGVVSDSTGSVYLLSQFEGILIDGQDTLDSGTQSGLLLAKYDSSGNKIWIHKLATGDFFYSFKSIAISGHYLIVFGGASNATFLSDSVPGNFCYLLKIDTNGNLIWKNQYETNFLSYISDISMNSSGSIFICGRLLGNINFDSFLLSGRGVFIASINASGAFNWALKSEDNITFPAQHRANEIQVSNSGRIYLAGYYNDSLRFNNSLISEPYSTNSFKNKFWVGCFDTLGNKLWLRGEVTLSQTTSGYLDCIYGLTLDSAENIYIAGIISDSSNIFGVDDITSSIDASFIAKLDDSGNLLWINKTETIDTLGSTGAFTNVHVSNGGEIVGTGWFNSSVRSNGITYTSNGLGDCVVIRLDQNGLQRGFDFSGGALNESHYQSFLDSNDNLYLPISFTSATLNLNPLDTLYNQSPSDSSSDIAIWKYCGIRTVGVNDLLLPNNEIVAYPNPFENYFYLNPKCNYNGFEILIYNINGEQIKSSQLEQNNYLKISLEGYPSGLYILELKNSKTIRHLKMIKY